MPKKIISDLLWRRLNKATFDSLTGQSAGQYDIRLTSSSSIEGFFRDLPQTQPTELGGFDIDLPIEALSGSNPVSAQVLKVRYMGLQSQRRDWNIPSQRPQTAYPLWRINRGLPAETTWSSDLLHFALLIRDTDNRFHARWLRSEDFAQLPIELQTKLKAKEVGAYTCVAGVENGKKEQEVFDRLLSDHNVMVYGPPGTGKTHLLQQIVRRFSASLYYLDTENERNCISSASAGKTKIGWVTFHQSYSYEEFIIGLRPDPKSTSLLNLKPTPGLLLELAEFARIPGNSALLVIDEINRGNVSRIFGEFITLMEPDKRLDKNGTKTYTTVEVKLPYMSSGSDVEVEVEGAKIKVPNPFTLPHSIYTLASMNSVDKSVAPIDTALRRRFCVVNLESDLDEINNAMGLTVDSYKNLSLPASLTTPEQIKQLALSLVNSINNGISFYRGSEYTIGQWYLTPLIKVSTLEDAQSELIFIWKQKILPQLEELFHGRSEQLEQTLRLDSFANLAEAPVCLIQPIEAMQEIGAFPYLIKREVKDDKLIKFLRHCALVKQTEPTDSAEIEGAEPS